MASGGRRGKLKVFLGYAAGVGKTYQMLSETLELKRQGPETVRAQGARVPGKGKLKPIEDAPGSYVKAR